MNELGITLITKAYIRARWFKFKLNIIVFEHYFYLKYKHENFVIKII